MEHYFNIEIAKKAGIEEAIFLHNLYYWIHKNAANNKMFFDGSYWTYNTKQSYAELFPYMNISKVKRVINTLVKEHIIKVGHYNENKMDRTSWYAFTDCGLAMMKEAGYNVKILTGESDDENDVVNQENTLDQSEPMEDSKDEQCTKDINNIDKNNKETLEINSRVKERLAHKYNKKKPLTDIEVKYYLGMEEKYPRVMRMDNPLLYRQYKDLLKKGVIVDKIIANLEAMENWKPLKDRVSAYQTLLTFIKKDKNQYAPSVA